MLTSGTPNGNSTLLKKFQVPYLFWNKSWNKVFADLLLKMYWSSTVTSIEKRKELQFNGPEQWLRNFIMVSGTWRADPSVNTLPSLLVGHTFSIVRVQILKKKMETSSDLHSRGLVLSTSPSSSDEMKAKCRASKTGIFFSSSVITFSLFSSFWVK